MLGVCTSNPSLAWQPSTCLKHQARHNHALGSTCSEHLNGVISLARFWKIMIRLQIIRVADWACFVFPTAVSCLGQLSGSSAASESHPRPNSSHHPPQQGWEFLILSRDISSHFGLLSIGTSTAELVQLYCTGYLLDIQEHKVYPAAQGIIFSWIGPYSAVLDPRFGYI